MRLVMPQHGTGFVVAARPRSRQTYHYSPSVPGLIPHRVPGRLIPAAGVRHFQLTSATRGRLP